MSDLYELPNGWEWIEYKKVFDNPTSKSYQIQKSEYLEDGLLPIVDQGKEFIVGYTNSTDKKYSNESHCIIFGDHTRQIKFIDFDFAIGADGTKILKEKDSNKFDLKYLYYQFKSKNIKSLGYSRHFKLVKEMFFAIPPLSEQQRIVSKLDLLFDKIDKSIALHQKNMDEADVFMGSILNDVFGELEEKYGKTNLKDIAILTMGQSPKSETYNTNGLGMPFFQGKKEFGKLHPIVEKYCTEPKKVAKDGDILMSVRAPVGPTNIADVDCAIGRGLCSIRAKENQFTMYIYYFLNHFEKDIEKMGKGSTFNAINKTETETLKVPSVSLSIQQKVVKYLDEILEKIEKVKSVQKDKMDSLKALKASILDRAFRGEL